MWQCGGHFVSWRVLIVVRVAEQLTEGYLARSGTMNTVWRDSRLSLKHGDEREQVAVQVRYTLLKFVMGMEKYEVWFASFWW